MNKYLRDKNTDLLLGNLFPFYILFQHSLFMTFKDDGVLNDIVYQTPQDSKLSGRDLFHNKNFIKLYRGLKLEDKKDLDNLA